MTNQKRIRSKYHNREKIIIAKAKIRNILKQLPFHSTAWKIASVVNSSSGKILDFKRSPLTYFSI